MKFMSLIIFILIVVNLIYAGDDNMDDKINVIPRPEQIKLNKGEFIISNKTKIMIDPENDEIKAIADFLKEKILTASGYDLDIITQDSKQKKNIIILLLDKNITDLNKEGYKLQITPKKVIIKANRTAGLFYGVQTLRQLLPAQIESPTIVKDIKWCIPCVEIKDNPRFQWRGMNFDCCRHFMAKEFVKRYIDLLAYYKMNILHWHLTEDQGWRIEIRKYPKLTSFGAWRIMEEGTKYGGFYSQEDVKEIVAYAASRHITVIPEIELPGHSVAALASYPEYSCTGGPFQVSNRWGVHKDVYCAGNDKTFEFLENILSEVVELFPAPYVHIGGDECPKDRWKECSKCQARIKKEGLKDEHELQSYFIKRIEKFLQTKNRRIIGWDEILEGGLASGATVQSWRGIDGAIAAARSGHDAIVSPNSHTYFNHSIQSTDLRRVYSFEPIPSILSEDENKFILGGECNIWTEHAPQETIDSKMFPRMLAMTEVLWSQPKNKNFDEFHQRLLDHYTRLDYLGVKYGFESIPVTITPSYIKDQDEFKIKLNSGEPQLKLFYTLDGSNPSLESNEYKNPFAVKDAIVVKAAAFKNNVRYGEICERVLLKHLAVGKTVSLKNKPHHKYPGNTAVELTNGLTGSEDYRDGYWYGFESDDFEAIIDLEHPTEIGKICARFLRCQGPWIFLPKKVIYSVSNNGVDYKTIATIENKSVVRNDDIKAKEFMVAFAETNVQYIKIEAENLKVCPEWHQGAGGKAWLFIDEIIVE